MSPSSPAAASASTSAVAVPTTSSTNTSSITNTIPGTTSTTTQFKSSIHLQTKRSTTRAFTSSLPSATTSNTSEAKYWYEKYGLGNSTTTSGGGSLPKYAHPRKLTLKVGTSSIVNQILFAPAAAEDTTATIVKSCPLAAVCGPRVKLYGTTSQSSFYRRLLTSNQQQKKQQSLFGNQTDDDKVIIDDVPADRQVQTGGDLALCGSFRNDGRLLAIGTDRGTIRVADVTTRATLCTFQTTSTTTTTTTQRGSIVSLPVRGIEWFRNGQCILSGGDDAVVRVWSLSNAMTGALPILSLQGHGDAVRSVVLWQKSAKQKPANSTTTTDTTTPKQTTVKKNKSNENWPYRSIAITGSYDHTIRLWNVDDLAEVDEEKSSNVNVNNNDRCLSVLLHGGPVEALLALPSASGDNDGNNAVPFWLISAGGTTIKVWNPRTGSCVNTINANHRKTITSLMRMPRDIITDDNTVVTTTTRIVTGGLDGLLRIHAWNGSTGTLQQIHGIALNGVAITALEYSYKASRLAIGTASGVVMLRQRGPSTGTRSKKRPPKAGTYSFFTRGTNVNAIAGDYVVGEGASKKRKLKGFDLALKQFRYGDALDEALETRIPSVVVAVLEELGKRRGLSIALSNRDEETLEPILAFLVRYINRPRFSALLIGAANMILDIYGDVTGQSEIIDEQLDKLKTTVTLEARTQRKLLRVMGQIDAIVASATTTTTTISE